MSKIALKKSNLENSPIISGSPNAKVSYGHMDKNKKSHWLKYIWIPIIAPIIVGLTISYMTNDDTKKDKTKPEIQVEKSNLQNSPIINKSPGAKVDYNLKTDNLNIFTDEDTFNEATGFKDPLGLYLNGKKVGTVIDPTINKNEKTFAFGEVRLKNPIPNNNLNYIFSAFGFDGYIVQANHIDSGLNTGFSPIIKGMQGIILSGT